MNLSALMHSISPSAISASRNEWVSHVASGRNSQFPFTGSPLGTSLISAGRRRSISSAMKRLSGMHENDGYQRLLPFRTSDPSPSHAPSTYGSTGKARSGYSTGWHRGTPKRYWR